MIRLVVPDEEREVLPLELVAQAPACARGLEVLAGEQRAHGLGAQRGGAADPALALVGVAPDQVAGERLQVAERPDGAFLDDLREQGGVVDPRPQCADPPLEEGRVADVVRAHHAVERDAAHHELAHVLDRLVRRVDLLGPPVELATTAVP